eukprot:2402393-Rhodomonas_salina.8
MNLKDSGDFPTSTSRRRQLPQAQLTFSTGFQVEMPTAGSDLPPAPFDQQGASRECHRVILPPVQGTLPFGIVSGSSVYDLQNFCIISSRCEIDSVYIRITLYNTHSGNQNEMIERKCRALDPTASWSTPKEPGSCVPPR